MVGAELARDGVVSVDINVECIAVFASKPAPTVDCVPSKVLGQMVGAELARDGVVSVDINVECIAVFASKLSSHRDCIHSVMNKELSCESD